MATSTDLQGSGLNQQGQPSARGLGGSNPNLQSSGDLSVLQASPSTLVVVGEKQPEVSTFPTLEIMVLGIILIAAIAGVILWFRD